MLYVIEYGCGCGSNEMIVEAENEETAVRFAWEKACEDYESFEGLHGIPDIHDVCEDYGIEDPTSSEAEEAYREERESWLDYSVEEFDISNESHTDLLETDGAYKI